MFERQNLLLVGSRKRILTVTLELVLSISRKSLKRVASNKCLDVELTSVWHGTLIIGEGTDLTNFRPIATLSAFTQIFEKLVYKQLKKLDFLFKYQVGFRMGRSTVQAITEIADALRKAIDNTFVQMRIFVDFWKLSTRLTIVFSYKN